MAARLACPFAQIVLDALHGFPKIGLADNVVSVKDGPRFVSADRYCHALRDTCQVHVPSSRPPEIVKNGRHTRAHDCTYGRQPWDCSGRTQNGPSPPLHKPSPKLCGSLLRVRHQMKHIGGQEHSRFRLYLSLRIPPFNQVHRIAGQGYATTFPVLCVHVAQRDQSSLGVGVDPRSSNWSAD